MRKWLISCLLFGTLSAQHFENGTLYHSRYVYPQGKGMGHIGQGETRLAVTTLDGRTCLESLPQALEGRRGICKDVAHHQGVAYAYGILNHPVFDRVGDAYFDNTRGNRRDAMPHAIFRRQGKGPWERWAKVDQALASLDLEVFEVLENERFLVRAMVPYDKRFPAPLCLWVPDGKGGMRGETLPSLAGEDPGFLASCKVVRIQDRFLLLPLSGSGPMKWLDFNGQRGGEGHVAGAPLGVVISRAVPRPDGKVLLQMEDRSKREGVLALNRRLIQKGTSMTPSEKLLFQRFYASHSAGSSLWAVLDPSSGRISPIAPPQGVDAKGNVVVLPSGHLGFDSGQGPFPDDRLRAWTRWMPNFWDYIMSFFLKGMR